MSNDDRRGARAPASLGRAARSTPGSYLPLIARLLEREQGAIQWLAEPEPDDTHGWIVWSPPAPLPSQGWKLHVSATLATAGEVLRRVVPELARRQVAFKIAGTSMMLARLNSGDLGASQAGKFMTVYAADGAAAVEVAGALDNLTTGLSGPRVPSDRQFKPGSIVSYRYGGFVGRWLQHPAGAILPAIEGPDGVLEEDRREAEPAIPGWAENPFPSWDVAPAPVAPLLLERRFIATGSLYFSMRGETLMGVDLAERRTCIIKRRERRVTADDSEPGASAFAGEAAMLRRAEGIPGIPAVIAETSDERFDYLVITDEGAETMTSIISERLDAPDAGELERRAGWARQTARVLAALHVRQIVHGDVKTGNIIIADDDRASLIDFSAAADPSSGEQTDEHTPGYARRERIDGAPLSPADDVFGLGAVLYTLISGAEASTAPDTLNLFSRTPALLNPECDPALENISRRALASPPDGGYPDMASFAAALDGWRPGTPRNRAWGDAPVPDGVAERARDSARAILRCLLSTANLDPDAAAVWRDPHPILNGVPARDLNAGLAGTVLALADLLDAFPEEPGGPETLAHAASRALADPPFAGGPLPGLYIGEAGIGLAALRAAQVLGDARLAGRASDHILATREHALRCPDLFIGTAGRLRAHLIAHEAIGDRRHLDAARECGASLAAAAEGGLDHACWTIPDGFGGLSGELGLGYAHGAAGIADTLAELWEVTGDVEARRIAIRAARWIASQAVDRGPQRVDWPASPGADAYPPMWCHGAAGIALLFGRIAALDWLPEAASLAGRASFATARGARAATPAQCHGLSGNIETLLDRFALTGDQAALAEANSLGGILLGWERRSGDRAAYAADDHITLSPSYWVGFGGVGAALLRLADPMRPRLLSRAGFRSLPALGHS